MKQERMKYLFTCLLLLAAGNVHAQLSGPNASCYNNKNDKYYITNYYGKSVVEMDRAGNKKTFITGLTAPNNILYGALPFGSGFLVLDSNTVEVFDSTGDNIASQSVAGAKKLQDCVIDDAAGALYTSDVNRGVIYKTTFGPAPFYIPSTTIFASGIARPSALLLQKSRNRILFVQDTTGSDLKALNLSNGQVSSLRSLGLNNVIGLAEDGQGNLYISSQGDKYIYQLNRFYAGTPVKLVSEPKPGDITVNPQKDEWVYTCILCGTVFIPRLHVFGPGNEQILCQGDSLTAYKNILQKCIGTFESGNEFIMELSNNKGLFSSTTFLAKVQDTLIPFSISAKLPAGVAPGQYKYRWRSTKPAISGSSETFTVNGIPRAFVGHGAHADTVYGCKGSRLTLGTGNSRDTALRYSWQPAAALDSANRPSASLQVDSMIRIHVRVWHAETGCSSSDSANIAPVSRPDPGAFDDTISVCHGDTAYLGTVAKAGFSYHWSPGHLLSDSLSATPRYGGDSSALFTLTVSAGGSCQALRQQFVQIHPLPAGFLNTDSLLLNCRGDSAYFRFIARQAQTTIHWELQSGGLVFRDTLRVYNRDTTMWGRHRAVLTFPRTGCHVTYPIVVTGRPYYNTGIRKAGDTGLTETATNTSSRTWYRNDTLLSDTARSIYPRMSGNYKVCGVSANGCNSCSAPVYFDRKANSSGRHTVSASAACQAYPNPGSGRITLPCMRGPWQLMSLSGKTLMTGNGPSADPSSLPAGMYVVKGNGMAVMVVRE